MLLGAEHLILHKLTYVGMFAFLIGSGTVVPLPEEIILLTAGYFTANGFMEPWRAIPIAIAALFIGDAILFFLARQGSNYVKGIHDKFIKLGLEKTWILSPDHPLRAVFIMRFMTGLRMIAPIYAGLNRASWSGFLATNLAALCIFVPAVYWLGYHYHHSFLAFVAGFEILRHVLFWGMVALVGGGIYATFHKHVISRFRRKPRQETPSDASAE